MPNSSARRRLLLTAYPPDGGVARHIIDLVTSLDADAWEIDIACIANSPLWRELAGRSNVRLNALRGSHGRPRASDLRDLPMLARLVERADVVHAHSSKAGFLTRLAASLRGGRDRTVFTPHAWSFWVADGVAARCYVGLERIGAHWCRTLIAVSEAERDAGLRAGVGTPSIYRVVLNGIDVADFADPHLPEPGRILMVGRLAPQKRPDVAIKAFALLKRTRPEMRLDIVGEGPLRSQLEGRIRTAGVSGSVRLVGSRSDVAGLLSRSACFLLTSAYEGCPLSVMEAMAAGVPVVASAVGGIPELIVDGKTGLLVEPGRPEAVAAALSRLVADPVLAETLGRAGREHARTHFLRDRMAAETAALYDEIVSG